LVRERVSRARRTRQRHLDCLQRSSQLNEQSGASQQRKRHVRQENPTRKRKKSEVPARNRPKPSRPRTEAPTATPAATPRRRTHVRMIHTARPRPVIDRPAPHETLSSQPRAIRNARQLTTLFLHPDARSSRRRRHARPQHTSWQPPSHPTIIIILAPGRRWHRDVSRQHRGDHVARHMQSREQRLGRDSSRPSSCSAAHVPCHAIPAAFVQSSLLLRTVAHRLQHERSTSRPASMPAVAVLRSASGVPRSSRRRPSTRLSHCTRVLLLRVRSALRADARVRAVGSALIAFRKVSHRSRRRRCVLSRPEVLSQLTDPDGRRCVLLCAAAPSFRATAQ